MSDKEIGQKMCEEHDLRYFIDAHKYVTGEELIIVSRSEKPDFICERNGRQIGVELTKIIRNPQDAFWDRVINRQDYMNCSHALDFVYKLVALKTKKKNKGNWIETILVLQLMDSALSEIKILLDKSLQGDFSGSGFFEIWLADYTGLDSYGKIELFGLYPKKWWGYHRRNNLHYKPYG
ncbi:MAG: hypothetical protein AB1668_07055 [Nanoarchaeota archaeon]